ncbi:BON domain-containing protein [Devosia sp. PTR5]|uniref:BON domain-containing protein n=1 Tax=Devosia oryzisoli TaxID=2774138 RepID=A0A927FQZ6_9HYPH|nr:BON domain-containing protein [Devosia oryzisoli]MBD8064421.1 BON domain-containing protein [Devosia oryzisoli]
MDDITLKNLINEELEFEPSIDAADIGVAVENGIVTLSGHVPNYAQKNKIEEVIGQIKGVRGYAEEIEVRFPGQHSTADDVLAKRAADLIRWNAFVPEDAIKVKVQKGYVTLTGTVEWQYQKERAYRAVADMDGIVGVYNRVDIKPRPTAGDVKSRIEQALKRNAELESEAIKVNVSDGKVTLEGQIKTWSERGIAERAAWAAPGVKQVEDRLRIS